MTPVRAANPWAVLTLATAVLVGDQLSKQWAIDALASPVHPMVVAGDGAADVVALMAGRGVGQDELARSIADRRLWRYVPTGALGPDAVLGDPRTPSQLVTTAAVGLPGPRRWLAPPGPADAAIGPSIAEQWRVAETDVPALLATSLRSGRPIIALRDVPSSDERVVMLHRDVPVIAGFTRLVYAENPGAAWGFMRHVEPPLRIGFFLLTSALASIAMVWAILTGWMGTSLSTWAVGAVLGGAVGNLVDRAAHGVVIDFILHSFGEFHWPVYNVADIGITVGVILILVELFVQRSSAPAPAGQAA